MTRAVFGLMSVVPTNQIDISYTVPSGELLWKDPPFLMGKLTKQMAIFRIAMLVHQRVPIGFFRFLWDDLAEYLDEFPGLANVYKKRTGKIPTIFFIGNFTISKW